MSNSDEAIEHGTYGGDVHAVDEAITLANTPRRSGGLPMTD